MAALLAFSATGAQAKGYNDYALQLLNPADLDSLAVASVDTTNDYVYLYDYSADKIVKTHPGPALVGLSGTATELNYLAGVTPGTVTASKALVVDSSLNLASINNLTLTGTFTGGASSDIAINTNKFTVAASSGNTVVAGTLGVTGALTASTINASGAISTTAATATATSNQLILGTTRTLTLTAPTPASSSRTVTLPDPGGSDTVVYNALAATLTNKTLTSPVITGPTPVACGGTCTLGAANLRAVTKLDTAAGSVATLPTATGTGNVYNLLVTVSTTSNSHKVLLATTTDVIIGRAVGFTGAGGASKTFDGSAATYHSLQMPFAGSQPSGGIIGDMITCTDVASALYACEIRYQGGTTPTTPFSTGTT